MALFDPSKINVSKKLEEALGAGIAPAEEDIKANYARLRKRTVAGQAAAGRASSGVADYPLSELDTAEGRDISGLRGRLAEALGGYGAQEYFGDKEHEQNIELARLIGELNKPKKRSMLLQNILSGATTGGSLGGPWGAVAGGVGGGFLGEFE